VFAVEPNAAMRAMAEADLASDPKFHSVDGSGEQTTLADRSVDLVTAAQSFHWLNPEAALREFRRILKSNGFYALIWNELDTSDTRVGAVFNELMPRFCPDYPLFEAAARNNFENCDRLVASDGKKWKLPYEWALDLESLQGFLRSLSVTPREGDPNYPKMMESAAEIFAKHHRGGQLALPYYTLLYCGR
jgi:SAM-dependent methyltransferase